MGRSRNATVGFARDRNKAHVIIWVYRQRSFVNGAPPSCDWARPNCRMRVDEGLRWRGYICGLSVCTPRREALVEERELAEGRSSCRTLVTPRVPGVHTPQSPITGILSELPISAQLSRKHGRFWQEDTARRAASAQIEVEEPRADVGEAVQEGAMDGVRRLPAAAHPEEGLD